MLQLHLGEQRFRTNTNGQLEVRMPNIDPFITNNWLTVAEWMHCMSTAQHKEWRFVSAVISLA